MTLRLNAGHGYRRKDAGLIPAYSEQTPDQLARTRDLARERQHRYQQKKRSEKMHGTG